ncbi:methylcrotonoyl-CoA carboxylase [Pacificimonas flava]|uniref:Methylcrotonoyl-CoA carboxylase n=2 Tax=Pacificimonas TaxID=1960290 RepID=A0A219B7K5_9SPHN|nr:MULTISPECIES: acetyl/propionyl/methylcrotonyl-CoA carboxylase subunit alpha [Pacificimonas]MBZ6378590.1 acetyl/propionyl/methylcrotonyl-CoA carboxylase subunit alpha [Pacificimonas aurantium]OWV34133.1 methylcrotonoyl-CoA carboxylase [Pacificimonas flava]
MDKLLIANRGEIACRVIRTARRMGIATVAVYSEADRDALHVAAADEAVFVGAAAARESYLDIDRIVAAARDTGADAIHPGYGFLSENAAFARRLEQEGIVFVGPTAASIEKMGLKDSAKALMKKAGVPVTPGYQGDDQSLQRLEKAAQAVGYPLLIKAVAGGGGKGMRRVDDPEDFAAELIAAKREGENSFGNGSVLIEKFITRPRHVEVQVFGDTHGNVVHLFERDCSLQRRHQKVIEEAPAPNLSERTRERLGDAAVRAAQAISYTGAGTIEFILDTEAKDKDGEPPFYFMEMNTRLQVEHPVTELVTGTDLIEWQFRVASGEPLPLAQAELAVQGHAVEARLYAEDPESGFLPSTGRLTTLAFPAETGGVRIDSGVAEGGEVTVHYDPMIAKVIACGPDRETAIDRLIGALDRTVVTGVKTNREFLARLIDQPAFRAGDVETGFIGARLDNLVETPQPDANALILAAVASAVPPETKAGGTMFARFSGWRMNLPETRFADLFGADGEALRFTLTRAGEGWTLEGAASADLRSVQWSQDGKLTIVTAEGRLSAVTILSDDLVEVRLHGAAYRFLRRAEAAAASPSDGAVVAPMPGRVLSLLVKDGQSVEAGAPLLVLEAMKMENRLTAAIGGVVTGLSAAEGDQVAEGAVLLTIEPQD